MIRYIMHKLFIWFCKNTSYSTGVALAGLYSAFFSVLFAFFYAEAMNLDLSSEVWLVVKVSILFSVSTHSLQSGILYKALGWGGFSKGIRILNKSVVFSDVIEVKGTLSVAEYHVVTHALNRLPLINTLVSISWVLIIFIVMLVALAMRSELTAEIVRQGIAIFSLIFVITGIFCFIFGEILTYDLRASVKKHATEKRIDYPNASFSSVWLKLVFFILLFLTTLYISTSLVYFHRDQIGSILYFSISAVAIAIFMAVLVFRLIFRALREVEASLLDLKEGGDGELFTGSLDREFISLARGVTSASKTVRDSQENLEQKVAERTSEVQGALSELEKRDNIMDMELQFAADIQSGIYPPAFIEWNGLTIANRWKAKEKVSGDYFDIFREQPNRLTVLMSDVSGHGMPGALITTMAKVAFQDGVRKTTSPAEIMRLVNQQLVPLIKTQDYITAFLLSFDTEHNFTYANASHQLALLVRAEDSSVVALDSDGLFLGALAEASDSFEEKENRLNPGDRLVLFTDGIVEFKNAEGQEYGLERLKDKIRTLQHESVERICDEIMLDLETFSQDIEFNDDVSIMVIGSEKSYEVFLQNMNAGKKFFENLEFEKAVSYFDRALEYYDKNINCLKTTAFVHYEMKNYDKSEQLFRKVLKFEAQDYETHFWLSTIAIHNKEYREALKLARKAALYRSHYIEAFNNMGIAHTGLGELNAAQKIFKKALHFSPDNEEIRKNIKKVEILIQKEAATS